MMTLSGRSPLSIPDDGGQYLGGSVVRSVAPTLGLPVEMTAATVKGNPMEKQS